MARGRVSGFLAVVTSGAALSALSWAASAHAQAVSPSTTLGEVVVTAQKRAENIEKTPIAITAVTANRIEQANLARPVQLQFLVPSMTYGYNVGYSFITLRGVGQDVTTTAAESSVATYQDGVYTGQTIAESVPSYDLQRIEVLRGPQGTLYGRNTTGGVINYISKLPSFDPGAYASVSYGNYNALQADGGVTGPIVADKIAGRFSIHYGDHNGYYNNITLGRKEYADRNISGRAAVLIQPTDDLKITLRGDMARDVSTDAYGLIDVHSLDGFTGPAAPLGVFSLPAAQLAAMGGVLSPADLTKLNGGSIADYYGLEQPGPQPPNPLKTRKIANGEPAIFESQTEGASATIDWSNRVFDLKSITAYRKASLHFVQDSGGIAAPEVFFNPLDQYDEQITQEIDLTGKAFGNRLDWLIGVFYYHDKAYFNDTIWLPATTETTNARLTLANPKGSAYLYNLNAASLIDFNDLAAQTIYSTVAATGPAYLGGGQVIGRQTIPSEAFSASLTSQESQSIAGFLQATWHVTDQLRLTGGFRFTADDKSAIRTRHGNLTYALTSLAFPAGAPPLAVAEASNLCDQVKTSKSWSAPTGTVGAEYDVAPRILTYAKASWGYKAGGMNPGECHRVFDPEYLTDYEGGVKAVFADGQILTNLAAYYYDYTNIQFTTFVALGSAILNAGSAKAFGVELEYAVRPHWAPGFEVDGSASFEDSHYGEGCFADAGNLNNAKGVEPTAPCPAINPANGKPIGPSASIAGNELVRAPRWKMNVGAEYARDLATSGTVTGRVEAAWTDTIYNDIFNGKAPFLADVTQPAYWILNARLTWRSPDNRYAVEVFGENLTDTYFAVNRVAFNTPTTVINVAGQFGPPRTFGVRLTMKLGSATR